MPRAILTPDGQLRQVVPKLLPTLRLEPGERIVAYQPPAHDPELHTCTPVLPVPAEAQAVQFTLADRPEALARLKLRKWAQIKAAREAEKVAPVLATPYGDIDADEVALANIKGTMHGLRAAADLGQPIASVTWTMADNTAQPLTLQQLDQIAVLLLQRGNAAHQKARTLRTQILAATTAAELAAVVW